MIGTLGTMTPYNKKTPAPAGKGLTETLSEDPATPSQGGRRRVKATRRRHPAMAFRMTSPGALVAAESPEGAVVSETVVDDVMTGDSGDTEDTAVEVSGSTTSGPLDMLKKLPLYAKLGLGGALLYLVYFVALRRKG